MELNEIMEIAETRFGTKVKRIKVSKDVLRTLSKKQIGKLMSMGFRGEEYKKLSDVYMEKCFEEDD